MTQNQSLALVVLILLLVSLLARPRPQRWTVANTYSAPVIVPIHIGPIQTITGSGPIPFSIGPVETQTGSDTTR